MVSEIVCSCHQNKCKNSLKFELPLDSTETVLQIFDYLFRFKSYVTESF